MKLSVRGLIVGSVGLTVGLGLWAAANFGTAGDVKDDVMALTELVAKKDAEGAKKKAEALAKDLELEEVMSLMKLRNKGGLGFGSKPAPAAAATSDGIEAKILALGRKALTQKEADAQADDLVKAANVAGAIGRFAYFKAPEKKSGNKDPKEWKQWTEDMTKAASELADAAKAKKPADIKAAATKLNASCNNCHGVFRD